MVENIVLEVYPCTEADSHGGGRSPPWEYVTIKIFIYIVEIYVLYKKTATSKFAVFIQTNSS